MLASIALCQLDKVERHRALRLRQVELYDAAVAELDGIEPVGARPARHPRAPPLPRPRSTPSAPARPGTTTASALADENIGTSVHFLPVHRSAPTASASPTRRRYRSPSVPGAELLSLPLSPAHSEQDIEDAIDALRRVHASFAG